MTDLLFQQLGQPSVNMFTTAENVELLVFGSRAFQLKGWMVDTLSLPWNGLDAYMFSLLVIIPGSRS